MKKSLLEVIDHDKVLFGKELRFYAHSKKCKIAQRPPDKQNGVQS